MSTSSKVSTVGGIRSEDPTVQVGRLLLVLPSALIAVLIPVSGNSGLMLGWALLAACVAVGAVVAAPASTNNGISLGLSIPLGFLILVGSCTAWYIRILLGLGVVVVTNRCPNEWCGGISILVALAFARGGRLSPTGSTFLPWRRWLPPGSLALASP